MRTPAAPARPTLLVPRDRPGRPVDVATRKAFIARQRQRGRRLRRVRRALRVLGAAVAVSLVLAAIAIAGAAAAHALQRSRFLAVSDVTVVGARRLSEAAVRAAAAIGPEQGLLALDAPAVTRRLEALPGVGRARVVRHLPNRVTLMIEEREPYALVNLGTGGAAGAGEASGLLWIDADGYLVGPERHGATPTLPVLSGVEPPTPGDRQPTGDRLHAGLALLRAVQRTGGRLAARISEIDLERPGGPVLYTVDGAAVWLGSEGWEERLARLDGVLGELEERGERVESVDLRFRDLVVLRPRPPQATTTATTKER
ncbi:MAG: FtsQ-type POTRA domain-containing protein [Candidatus Rokubacteria bacterium]|nr:FtsQ-type POTRA domain-containing protein [Candidatus Rokubacteria bacterium]